MPHDVPAPAADVPAGPVPRLTPVEAALIAETCSRGEVIWVRPPDEPRHHAAWHVWHEDGPVLVYGVGEQMLPLLSGEVEVVARAKETGARLVTFVAYARTLTPGSAEWEAATTELAAHRLNATDPAGARERWASGGLVTALRPLWLVRSGTGEDDAGSGAQPPARGPATTLTRRPFHLGRRRRRARRRARG